MIKNNKTIGVTIRFFTNDLPSQNQFWVKGMASVEANKEKGIIANQAAFNTWEGILPAVRKAMRKSKLIACDNEL